MKLPQSLAGLVLAASLFLPAALPAAQPLKVVGDKVNMTPSIPGGAPIKLTIYNFNPTPATGFWVTPAGVLASLPGAPTIPPTGTTPITINSFRYATVFCQRSDGGGRWGHLAGPNPNPVMILGTPPPGFKVNQKNLAGGGGEVPADNAPDDKKKKVVNVKNVTNTTTTVTPPAAPVAPAAPAPPAPVAPAPTAPKAAAARPPFEDGGYFYLSSRFTGEEKVLSAVKAGPIAKAELAAKRDKKANANQSWKVTPLGNGFYRLTTKALGDGFSIDVIGDDPENNQIQLVKTEEVSGQAWKITEEKDGYFRLTTQFKGPSLSLDVCNEGDKSKMVGLIGSNDSSGQFWMFRKASGASPAIASAKAGKKPETASATAVAIDPAIKGANVAKVTYKGPAQVQVFTQNGPGRWTSAQVGYREVERDEFSVYLVRAKAENEKVQIDLWTKTVTFTGQGPDVSYPILSASGGK